MRAYAQQGIQRQCPELNFLSNMCSRGGDLSAGGMLDAVREREPAATQADIR